MKTILAYALLVLPIPNVAGLLASVIIQMPVTRMWQKEGEFGDPAKSIIWQTLEIVSGFVAVLAALYLFKFLSVKITWAIPIVIGAWTTVYYFAFKQPKWEWVCWLLGIVAAWFVMGPAFKIGAWSNAG